MEWSGFPGFDTFETAALEHRLDFDRVDWKRTESLVFSRDLLRIACGTGREPTPRPPQVASPPATPSHAGVAGAGAVIGSLWFWLT